MNSEHARGIERMVIVSLPNDRPPTEEEVRDLAERLRIAFPVSDEEFDALIKRLHAKVSISMDTGLALVAEHRPWLSARKPTIDPFYWERFQQLLMKKDWPPRVVATLDRVTDDILDLLGNPLQEGSWGRRGLVVGDVQSGKTATYTALCCKAGDAGYHLVILLTGTLESLRRQTQERLDEGFVGLDSSGELTKIRTGRAVGVGLIDPRKAAGVFTSRDKDFNKTLLNALGFRLDIFQNPVLVVVKKNKRILENLEKWLTEFNAGPNKKIDAPVLVIDDEADSASINTRAANEDPTAINRRIRSLLRLFTHSSYVGFTATPFANVFIDPDTDDEMLGSDLFPRDFIYSLEAPTNYLGPQAVFGEEPSVAPLREIDDADITFPSGHKSTLLVEALPPTLEEAARTFLLSTTIRDLRSEGPSHRSMLVNVSRFTAVQDQVAALLHTWLSQVQQDIRNYSQLPHSEALRNENLKALHATWQKEFSDHGFAWPAVQAGLVNGALPVAIQAVNQRTGAASLDYAKHRENGLRVIAVGGNSLSRGLTLEGLSTSYFFRNSQMYDTLLQMGRWFGYRDGYADLCRLWLTDDAMHWYAHITMATDELRAEFRRMRQQDRTPKDFGLKVRAHPDSLIVTAQNKMRQSKLVERVISISGESLETTRLKTNENVLRANKITVERFLDGLRAAGQRAGKSRLDNPFWRAVPKAHVVDLLNGFDVHPMNISFQARDLADFLAATSEGRLQEWDVVLPQGEGDSRKLGDVTVRRNKRRITLQEGSILVSGRNARVGSRGIEREGLSEESIQAVIDAHKRDEKNKGKSVADKEYREHRERPLLLIHVIEPSIDDAEEKSPPDDLIALGLSFPRFNDTDVAKRVMYRVNLVEWNALVEHEIDDQVEDEAADDAG
jgi:hypothetical protein